MRTTREQELPPQKQGASTLLRLTDSGLRLADQGADIRGKKVYDSAREEIGKVHDLLIDEAERKVRFLEVASGGFLGLGDTKVLIPVEAVTGITEDEVRINQTRSRIAGAPRYNPDLIEEPFLNDVYAYYGAWTPFWGPGYVYPRYPYF
jgi:sporulation protein YlmC with PRC-barrel domain